MSERDDAEKSIESVTEQEREYAQSALAEFNKCNYGGSLQFINKLDARTYDFKVAHNKAVVDYYKSDLKKTDAFQKSLTALCTQFHLRSDKIDDVDHCVVQYNQAVLLFHQRQYTNALRIIDRVYKFIEPMDDALAKQVGLLFIELQICLRQPDKAIGLITYLENHLINGGVMNIKLLDKKGEQKEKKIVAPVLDEASEAFRRKLLKYKIRCFLLKHTLGVANNEIGTLPQDNVDVLFLRANLEYLQGNYEGAVKTLTSIPNECLLYSETGESSTIMFYNNMGVIHLALSKPNLACHYFQNALKEDIAINSNSKKENGDKPLYMLGGSKYHELMYNLGLALLHAGRATQAFDCLIIAVRRYHRNSRLWLRLAECCIMAHKSTNEVDFIMKKKQKELISEVIGSRDKQAVVLTTNLSKDKKYSTDGLSYAVPVATLEFASLCLRNAHLLLPSSDTASSPVPLLLIPGITPPAPPPSPGPAPSAPLSPDGIVLLRNAILIASSYVSLCLGDYIMSLEHAQMLLAQPRVSCVHKLLAHLYAAESLVLLDKIGEALEHLKPENVEDLTFELPPDEEEPLVDETDVKTTPPIKWFPNSLSSAHAVMQYNMAVAKTIRGQLDQAGALLRQIWQTHGVKHKVPTHIIMLVLYIELQLGHTDSARSLIRQYSLQGL